VAASIDRNRLRWLCRRGMGELDRLLRPFVDDALDDLPVEQQRALAEVLELSDPELFALISGRKEAQDATVAAVVAAIRRHADA